MKVRIFAVFLFWSVWGMAQEIQDSIAPYKSNILPTPSFTYSDQTDFVLGAYVLYQFKFDKMDYASRSSYVNAYVASSFNDQFFLSSEHRVYTPKEKWFLRGYWEYKQFPEPYFGIGSTTSPSDVMIVEYDFVRFEQSAHYQFKPSMFAGLQARYINYYNVDFKTAQGEPSEPPNEFYAEGDYLGLGPSYLWDKRNSLLTPTQNYFLEGQIVHYLNLHSSQPDFTKLKFDARKYFDLKNNGTRVLAFQLVHESALGTTPLQELPKMGGNKIARGYLEGRFRDKSISQIQAELRQHIFWRLGVTAFAHFGEVYSSFEDIDIQNLKSTIGMGLRFNINKKDPANIRVDFGWSLTDQSNGIYFTFGEAF